MIHWELVVLRDDRTEHKGFVLARNATEIFK